MKILSKYGILLCIIFLISSVKVNAAGTSMEHAETLPYDTELSGVFTNDNQEYWYQFKTSNQEAWTLISLNSDSVDYADLNLYDSYGMEQNSINGYNKNQKSLIYKLSADSSYYVCISNFKQGKMGEYHISLNQMIDDVANTFETSKSIKDKDSFSGNLELKGDIDCFKLQSSVYNSWNQIKVINKGISSIDVILYDINGEVLNDTIVDNNSSACLNEKFELNTTYYISISCDNFSSADIGSYQISYKEIKDDSGDCLDDSKIIKVNKTVTKKLEVAEDVDYFKYKSQNSKYTITIKNESNGKLNAELYFWDGDEFLCDSTTVAGNKSSYMTSSSDKFYYIRITGNSPAKYTIKVKAK